MVHDIRRLGVAALWYATAVAGAGGALESEQEIAVRQGRFRLEAGAPAQP